MGDGELDFSTQEVFKGSNIAELPSCLMDSLFDELLNDNYTCMHTHTYNPLEPDSSHTHTCFHVHTKVSSDDKLGSDDSAESAEKQSKKGNKEATRKYREKRKAQAAFLNKEVERLEAVNQQLRKRLQGQAALEAENLRLKCLLVDIRGRIEGEIGSFPYQKPAAYVLNPCNMQSNDRIYCLHQESSLNGQVLGGCEFESQQCLVNQNSGFKELPDTRTNHLGTSNNRKGRSRAGTAG